LHEPCPSDESDGTDARGSDGGFCSPVSSSSTTHLASHVKVPPTLNHGQVRRRDKGQRAPLLLSPPNSRPLKQELSQFIEQEQTQARVQESIHKMTSMCWDKYASLQSSVYPPRLTRKKRQVRDWHSLHPFLSLRRVLSLLLRRPLPRHEPQTCPTHPRTEERRRRPIIKTRLCLM